MGKLLKIPLATNLLAGLLSPIEKRKINNILVVDAGGNGDYSTVESALANAADTEENHVVILVMPGIYYPSPKEGVEVYREANRNLSLIGINTYSTMLVNDNGYYYNRINYDNAPLRLSGNVLIKNLTIKSTSNNFLNYCTEKGLNPVDETYGTENHRISYCIHNDRSRQAGDVTQIENCILINDHFSVIGFGLKPNSTLKIKNCYCQHADDLPYSRTGYGAIYGHLSANSIGLGQNIELIGNTIISTTCPTALILMDSKSELATPSDTGGQILLQKNICKTTDTQNGYVVVPSLNGFMQKSELSFANNILLMNY